MQEGVWFIYSTVCVVSLGRKCKALHLSGEGRLEHQRVAGEEKGFKGIVGAVFRGESQGWWWECQRDATKGQGIKRMRTRTYWMGIKKRVLVRVLGCVEGRIELS